MINEAESNMTECDATAVGQCCGGAAAIGLFAAAWLRQSAALTKAQRHFIPAPPEALAANQLSSKTNLSDVADPP
jgi:hypothetical protein